MTYYANLSQLIFLGNFPELDTDEGTGGFEGSTAPIVGTTLSGPTANDNVVSFDYDDVNDDGNFGANHFNPGEVLVVGGVSSVIDEIVILNFTITYPGGATELRNGIGYQLDNGNLYLGGLNGSLETPNIESLEITSVTDTGDGGPISGFQNGGVYDMDTFSFAACFEGDTEILTDQGERKISDLQVGDLVATADNGLQPIRWASRQDHRWSAAVHHDKPIMFPAGSLGAGLPRRDLQVSPQHRMLIACPDQPNGAFAAAKKLVGLKGVRQMKGRRSACYVHIMFDAHAVIFAEGAPSESYFPGPQAVRQLSFTDHAALRRSSAPPESHAQRAPARPILTNSNIVTLIGGGEGCWTDQALRQAQLLRAKTGNAVDLPQLKPLGDRSPANAPY